MSTISTIIIDENRNDCFKREISELVIMIAISLISFSLTKLAIKSLKCLKARYERRQSKRGSLFSSGKPFPDRGGDGFAVDLFDESEIALTILSCISNENNFLVRDQRVLRLIFKLVEAKMMDESLVISPNLLRFLALRLLKPDSSLWMTITKHVVMAANRRRLLIRFAGAAAVGAANAIVGSIFYTILSVLIVFNSTGNCYHPCDRYFERLPESSPQSQTRIYARQPTGNILIAANDDARQVEIFVPSKQPPKLESINGNEVIKSEKFVRSRKKAKQVLFEHILKKDPMLQKFQDKIEEPIVPQQKCIIDRVMNN